MRWCQRSIAVVRVFALVAAGLYAIWNRAGAAGIVVALLAAAAIAWLIRRWLCGLTRVIQVPEGRENSLAVHIFARRRAPTMAS